MSEKFVKNIEIRWADLDPNGHVLHSRYYDFGAFMRTAFLHDKGLTLAIMHQRQFGPIIFREECIFRREIRFGDLVTIDVELLHGRRDASRWTFRHHIYINGDKLAAILTIDGAWLDTHKRKLATPPEDFAHIFEQIPRASDFYWSDPEENKP
jgi:acyl-CoA thioester hydrolase